MRCRCRAATEACLNFELESVELSCLTSTFSIGEMPRQMDRRASLRNRDKRLILWRIRWFLTVFQRQFDGKGAALLRAALELDAATMQPDDLRGDVQP